MISGQSIPSSSQQRKHAPAMALFKSAHIANLPADNPTGITMFKAPFPHDHAVASFVITVIFPDLKVLPSRKNRLKELWGYLYFVYLLHMCTL